MHIILRTQLLLVWCCFSFLSSSQRKIYIDLGTNNGDSILSFLNVTDGQNKGAIHENSALNGDSVSHEYLWSGKNGTDMLKDKNWEVFAFEANPNCTPQLKELQEHLLKTKQVKAFRLYDKTAMTTKNGNVTFIFDNKETGDAGSTLMSESKSAVGTRISVKAVDIVHFFHTTGIKVDDYVVLKMDIEGAEYKVVRRILLRGLLKFIDKIAVEWHHNAWMVFGAPEANEFPEPLQSERMAIHRKYKAQYEAIMWLLEESTFEKGKFVEWG